MSTHTLKTQWTQAEAKRSKASTLHTGWTRKTPITATTRRSACRRTTTQWVIDWKHQLLKTDRCLNRSRIRNFWVIMITQTGQSWTIWTVWLTVMISACKDVKTKERNMSVDVLKSWKRSFHVCITVEKSMQLMPLGTCIWEKSTMRSLRLKETGKLVT